MSNFYTSPGGEATPASAGQEPFAPRPFSLEGRIGRVRYLLYSLFPAMLFWVLMLVVDGIAAARLDFLDMLDTHPLYLLALMAINFVIMRRRLNDIDRSGWLGLLVLVPFVNFPFSLYLLFAPGTLGENRYGLAPAPNPPHLLGYCLVLPVLLIIVVVKVARA
jgi:uncharacterized membrane protein YhaH (DUF805 family)